MNVARSFLAIAILAATARARALPGPSGLVQAVHDFENLSVGAGSAPVANLRLTTGHLECVLVSGRAVPVRAGDEVVGIYFEGNGTMDYTSVEPIEAPVVQFVAKKATSLSPVKTGKGIQLHDRFTRMLWIAAGEPLAELANLDGAAASLAGGLAAQRLKGRRIHAVTLSHAFAAHRLDGYATPLVRVELDGGGDDFVYEHEGHDNPSETLWVLRSVESNDPLLRNDFFLVTVSDQPLGWDRRDPPRPRFVLTDVDVELKASDGSDAKISVLETFVPQRESRRVLRLDLDNTLYTGYGTGLATRGQQVKQVTDEAGRSLPFYHQNGEILVQLAEPALPDHPVKVRFQIEGDFLIHPGGDSFWELGTRAWFPQPELGEQYYTFHAVIHVKKPFVPFAPGRTIRRTEEGDENVLETREDKPIQFAVILAGAYTFQEDVRDGVTIRVATYALKNPRAMKQLTDLAATIIQYYTEFLGPFPFPEFNIIEINDFGFGQAPPGILFITKEAFNPLVEGLEGDMQLYSKGVNERFAHEIAHQYWGHVVKMPGAEEQWLSESFAEYTAGLFIKAAKGEAEYKSLFKHWKGRANQATDVAPIPLANRIWISNEDAKRWFLRTGLLYNKGPVLLAALHRELGDEVFLTFLKSYQKSFRWKFGSTKTVEGLLQFMTKKDYGPFFEAYYWGLGMPKD